MNSIGKAVSKSWWLVAPALAMLGGVALVHAEQSTTDDSQKVEQVSPIEAVKRANEYIANINQTAKRINKLQEAAQKSKDMVKLNCVNDKLMQARGLIAVAEKSRNEIQGAVAKNDGETSSHELSRMAIAHQKVSTLGIEAEACVGDDINYIGSTQVTVDVDPNVPEDDPTAVPLPTIEPIPRPPEESPFGVGSNG